MQIIQTLTEVIELFEYDHIVRYIYTDGRKHPADLTPSYNGHSIGHWEGATLVVDTVGLNGKNWLDRLGHPESDQMYIVERIHRADEKTLQVDFTFDDPKSYVKPWTAMMRFQLKPGWEIIEHVCEDNFAFESFEHYLGEQPVRVLKKSHFDRLHREYVNWQSFVGHGLQ